MSKLALKYSGFLTLGFTTFLRLYIFEPNKIERVIKKYLSMSIGPVEETEGNDLKCLLNSVS